MKLPRFKLLSVPLVFFVAQPARAFSRLAVLPTTFLRRHHKLRLRISSKDTDKDKNGLDVSLDEIEAMGGDAFFWSNDYDDVGTTTDSYFATEPTPADQVTAMGGDPFFLSHEDHQSQEQLDSVEDDEEPPPSDLLQAAMAASSFGVSSIMQRLKQDSLSIDSSPSNFDKTGTEFIQRKTLDSFEDEDEVLSVGGDPFFLSDGNNRNGNDHRMDTHCESEAFDEILALGGDPFFLQEDEVASSKVNKIIAVATRRDNKDQDHDNLIPHLEMLSKIAALSVGHQNKINLPEETKENDSRLSAMEMLSQMAAMSAVQNQGSWAMAGLQPPGKTDSGRGDDASPNLEADLFEELEEMGGDPFFLDLPGKQEEIVEVSTLSKVRPLGGRCATDGQGPTPRSERGHEATEGDKWEWDGIVDEDAHLGRGMKQAKRRFDAGIRKRSRIDHYCVSLNTSVRHGTVVW